MFFFGSGISGSLCHFETSAAHFGLDFCGRVTSRKASSVWDVPIFSGYFMVFGVLPKLNNLSWCWQTSRFQQISSPKSSGICETTKNVGTIKMTTFPASDKDSRVNSSAGRLKTAFLQDQSHLDSVQEWSTVWHCSGITKIMKENRREMASLEKSFWEYLAARRKENPKVVMLPVLSKMGSSFLAKKRFPFSMWPFRRSG